MTLLCIILAYSIVIYVSLKHPSPDDIYIFIWIPICILLSLILGYFIDKYIILKRCPKEIGFSTDGIHFKYLTREDYVKWDNIKHITKDFTYPLMAWKIYQKNDQKMDLAMCDKEIINEIQNRFDKSKG